MRSYHFQRQRIILGVLGVVLVVFITTRLLVDVSESSRSTYSSLSSSDELAELKIGRGGGGRNSNQINNRAAIKNKKLIDEKQIYTLKKVSFIVDQNIDVIFSQFSIASRIKSKSSK